MRNFCCGLLLLLAAGILFSCGSTTKEKKFFDIPGYFKNEIDYIQANYSKVSKTSTYNGDKKIKDFKVEDINWQKEFGLFLECDINKPVYYAYLNETDDGDYWTLSKKTPVKSVDIEYQRSEEGIPTQLVSSVKIKLNKSNLISSSSVDLYYQKDYKYQVQGEQYTKWLGNKNTFFIEGVFLK